MMPISYRVFGLQRNADGSVTVTLMGYDSVADVDTADSCVVLLPAGSPAIALLTIGRQVNAVFTAV